MQWLTEHRDIRTVLGGVAIAAVSGMLMGAAFRPELNAGGLIAPQTLLAGGGARSEPQAAIDPGLARYGDHVPDYVVGVDWLRQQQPPVMAPEHDAPEAPPEVEAEATVYTSQDQLPRRAGAGAESAWREPMRAPVSYPSNDGGVVYETDLPPPPAPPTDTDVG